MPEKNAKRAKVDSPAGTKRAKGDKKEVSSTCTCTLHPAPCRLGRAGITSTTTLFTSSGPTPRTMTLLTSRPRYGR